MNVLIRSALASLVALTAVTPALADTADSKGGLHIKSDDGGFEGTVGGRIQFDANIIKRDEDAAFGSGTAKEADGAYLRRAYLTLSGKLYGWSYKFEPDFAPDNATGSPKMAFEDLYMSHGLGPGQIVIGQIKPFRGMEELTSSNDLTMIERPYASAAGVFNGGRSREFEMGVFYRGAFLDRGTYGVGGYSLRRVNTPSTQGLGANGRVTYAPILDNGRVLHLGVSYSVEKPDLQNNLADGTATGPTYAGSGAAATVNDEVGTTVAYAGRRGPGYTLGTTKAYDRASTLGLEVAGQWSAAVVQGEYMRQKLGQGAGVAQQTVDAYYVQAGLLLTGENRAYRKDVGVFGGVKPTGSHGALELAARFDHGENNDAVAEPEVQSLTVGLNWYPNPNVKFMVDEIFGKAEQLSTTNVKQDDKPKTLALRAQIAF